MAIKTTAVIADTVTRIIPGTAAGSAAGALSVGATEWAFAYAFLGGICVVLYRLSKAEPTNISQAAFPIVAGTVFGAVLANVLYPTAMAHMTLPPADPKWILFALALVGGFLVERIVVGINSWWDFAVIKSKKK